jgi:hypothetical protein
MKSTIGPRCLMCMFLNAPAIELAAFLGLTSSTTTAAGRAGLQDSEMLDGAPQFLALTQLANLALFCMTLTYSCVI